MRRSTFLVVAIFAPFLILLAKTPRDQLVKRDFTTFYAAARLVSSGNGHQLYDREEQIRAEQTIGASGGLYYNHAPFEMLFFLPLSRFSLSTAFALWSVLNAIGIALSAHLLQRIVTPGEGTEILGLLFLFFVPTIHSLVQGQSGGILLAIFVGTFILLKRQHDFCAGLLLAVALTKFHLVVPFVAIMFLHRQWRFLRGFATGAIVLCLGSLPICGWRTLLGYPQHVLAAANVRATGVAPEVMPNLRGVLIELGSGKTTIAVVFAIFAIAILLLAWHGFRRESDLAVAAVMATGLVVVYHIYVHDLTLLLLPLGICVAHLRGRLRSECPLAILAFLVYVPVTHILLYPHYAWMGLLVIAFIAAMLITVIHMPGDRARMVDTSSTEPSVSIPS